MTNPDAVRHEHLSYGQVLNDRLAVLDATAVSLCMDNDLPIVVFDMNASGQIRAAALGEGVGTLIDGDGDDSTGGGR
jgi:uridylate kinase